MDQRWPRAPCTMRDRAGRDRPVQAACHQRCSPRGSASHRCKLSPGLEVGGLRATWVGLQVVRRPRACGLGEGREIWVGGWGGCNYILLDLGWA